jgi:hypothetical protein
LITLLALAACGGDDEFPDPAISAPAAPAENDTAFEISQVRTWYLVGDAVTSGQDTLNIQVLPPEGTDFVDAWVNDRPGVRLVPVPNTNTVGQAIDISDLAPGEHTLILGADGSSTGFARLTFYRSHPLYVVVTTDWDYSDPSDDANLVQDELHDEHPELLLTHFVGPYTFTDSEVTATRATELADWVKEQRDEHGDEIGLHIHPYCNFVEAAGLTCRTEPSTTTDAGDPSGYTVMCAAYTETEFETLLDKADELFMANGMGKPTSFRAGGWTADLSTLKALAAAGYVADTSALNWARLEEWKPPSGPLNYNGVLWEWNMTHWSSIGDTSQPYYPSESDILVAGTPHVGLLEVPDNGIMVDYVSGEEMIEIFDKNWDGSPLLAPVNYSIGYHPTPHLRSYKPRLTEILNYVDAHSAARDGGPAVYATLSDMAKIWPAPQ